MADVERDASYWHRAWMRRTVQVEDLSDRVDDLELSYQSILNSYQMEHERFEGMIQSLQGSVDSANAALENQQAKSTLVRLMLEAAESADRGEACFIHTDPATEATYVLMPLDRYARISKHDDGPHDHVEPQPEPKSAP